MPSPFVLFGRQNSDVEAKKKANWEKMAAILRMSWGVCVCVVKEGQFDKLPVVLGKFFTLGLQNRLFGLSEGFLLPNL